MDTKTRAFQAVALIMGLLFVFSAALQYNDPDPALWMLYYALAAVVSFVAMRKEHWGPPLLTAVLGLIWLVVLVANGLPDEPHPMKIGPQTGWLADEVVREGGGLLIVLSWMAVLGWRARKSA